MKKNNHKKGTQQQSDKQHLMHLFKQMVKWLGLILLIVIIIVLSVYLILL